MTQPATNSNYTSDEIQAAVTKLVLSTIRRPYDTLGVRRTDISFTDVQQAAAGVFVLFPNSPFYVLFLGTKRLNAVVSSEATILDQLLSALNALNRQVLPVDDVSPLFNAQAALQALGSAAVLRGGTYADITKAPAYQQYATNVQAFLSGPGQSIKSNGNIVQTPQQARAAIPGLMTQLSQAHAALVAKVTSLANGMVDYNGVSLPSIVASSVLSNSAALIGANATALNALTPEQRLGSVRQVVLDLLATNAAVKTFGSFTGPSDFYTLDGLGHPFSDAQHLANPAVAQATKGGGYSIVQGVSDDLNVTADGGAPFDIILNPSVIAQITGSADDSGFVIGNGVLPVVGVGSATPNNNKFKLKVNTTPYVATLTLSGSGTAAKLTGTGDTTTAGWYGGGGTLDTKTLLITVNGTTSFSITFAAPADATALVSQINAVTNIGTMGVTASVVANRLVLTSNNVGKAASLLIGGGSSIGILGFAVSQGAVGTQPTRTADQVAADINAVLPFDVLAEGYYFPLEFSGPFDIPAGVNTTWPLTGGPGSSDLVALGVKAGDTVHVLSGPNAGIYPIASLTSSSITITGTTVLQAAAPTEVGPVNRKLRIRCINLAVQVPAETLLTVYGDDTPSNGALTTLGFFNGTFSQCLLTTPDLVANDINGKTGVLSASTAVTPLVGPVVSAHADVTNPNHVVFSSAAAAGDTTFIGAQVTLTVTSVSAAGAVSSGDTLALRGGLSPGHGYVIATVNGVAPVNHQLVPGDVVVANGSFAGLASTGVDVEFGPTLTLSKYQVVTIGAPSPSSGNYFVQGQGDTAIDVLLINALPQVRSITSSTSSPLTVSAQLGVMYLVIASKNTTTSSALVLQGDAALTFFSASPHTQLGTSSWFALPSIPRGLQPGDVLEYYSTDYKTPSSSYVITQVISGLKVLQVAADPVSGFVPDGSSWQFSPQPVPFARLRMGVMNDFAQVQALLTTWLVSSVNQPLFFENFNRLINPLLANANPTAAQIGVAVNTLLQLYAYLTIVQATAVLGQPSVSLEAIIQTFTVEPIPAIDTLIRSFIEKGSDRATDLLLAGKFSTFFTLTADQASYSGAFQASTRAVAMNDLPVRRINRPEAQSSQLISQAQSPDFEYTAASVNETIPGAQVNPPTDFGTPSNFGTTTGSSGAQGQ